MVIVPAGASAATINVHPGQNAIQRGINRADRGDVLRVHSGVYRGDVDVDKRVTLRGVGPELPIVDGQCDSIFVIDVQRNGVIVEDLKVKGAEDEIFAAEVNFENIEKGTARDLVVRDSCGAGPEDGAGYGVNVYRGEELKVRRVNAKGFSDAGIYIGSIDSTGSGRLLVADNETFGSAQGIIIEEVEPLADVLVKNNETYENGKGFFGHISVGAVFEDNTIRDNTTGIHLDPGSEDNEFSGNTLIDNTTNLLDEGEGNCGSGNSPEVFSPCV